MNDNHDPIPQLPMPWLSVSPLAMDLLLASGLDPLALLKRQRSGDWGEVNERDRKLNDVGIREGNALLRHVTGDWGDVSDDDKRANEHALVDGDRLLSAYKTKLGEKLWVITEADRQSTTALRPDVY